uniref:Uncharacterized protein n=1 Tax=Vespula pensylvanica TaxID=30213 RepID=A0A834UDF6_VESPE|nr:hypothetical protein H0235_005213 [Vespula pensylvanica]
MIPRTRTSHRLSTNEFLIAESAKSQSTDRDNEASGIVRITETESTKTRLNEIKEELMALLSFSNIEYRRRSVTPSLFPPPHSPPPPPTTSTSNSSNSSLATFLSQAQSYFAFLRG